MFIIHLFQKTANLFSENVRKEVALAFEHKMRSLIGEKRLDANAFSDEFTNARQIALEEV